MDVRRFHAAIAPYEEDFAEVLRVIELSSDFVLLPVIVPGPDLASMLATWLAYKEHPVTKLEYHDTDAWKNLSTQLSTAKPEPNGVVMVIAGGDLSDDLSLPLRLVNERRDSIAKHLQCPLLWCGSSEFLVQTGQQAPDFWSVRAVERKIEARPVIESRKTQKKKESAKGDLLDEALRQRDRKSAEILFLSRLRQAMTDAEDEAFDAIVASIPAEYEDVDPTFAFELTLMKAEMARRQHHIGQALEWLDACVSKAKSPDERCRIELLRGRIWERAGDTGRAIHAFVGAFNTKELANPIWKDISSLYLTALKTRRVNLGADDRNDIIRELTERLGVLEDNYLRALGHAILAEALALQHHKQRARHCLGEAMALYEASMHEPTVLFGGEVEEAMAQAKQSIEGLDVLGVGKEDAADESDGRKRPIATIAGGIEDTMGHSHPPPAYTRSWVSMAAIAFGIAGIFAMVIAWAWGRWGDHRPKGLYCFANNEKEVICAESLEQCERFIVTFGYAGRRTCHKPLFAP